jgi:uncharacterized protein YuzE
VASQGTDGSKTYSSTMRMTYESQHKVAYLYLVDEIPQGRIADTVKIDHPDLKTELVFDLDAKGRILGIEILNTKGLAPEAIEDAERN